MNNELIELIKSNVVKGRRTCDDEGIDETPSGAPGVTELTREALEQKIPLEEILNKGLADGLDIVGRKFESGEYFIPDMLIAAEAVSAAMKVLSPQLIKEGRESKGKILIATVEGDQHDIGKNLVATMMRGAGFEVIDLGVDVKAEKIIEAVKSNNPGILGLSALLTTTMQKMKETIDLLEKNNLRSKVKVIIGGAPTSTQFAKQIGADAHCKDAFIGVETVKALFS